MKTADTFGIKGHVRIEVRDRHGRLTDVPYDGENFIVNVGKQVVMDQLAQLFEPGRRTMRRMGLGDQGAITGSPFTPKVPDATWPARTALFHELGRKNIDIITSTAPRAIRFMTAFLSSNFDPTSYSAAPKICSEASLYLGDPADGVVTLIQPNKAPPTVPPVTDVMFSTRTFKSVPFDPADGVTVTVTWTIFIT